MKREYQVNPIPLVRKVNPKAFYTYLMNWGESSSSCDGTWFIRGADINILIDTGRSSLTSSLTCVQLESIQTLEQGLGNLGLSPKDIDMIILTHLHYDHIELAHKYPDAKFIVQKAELDFARRIKDPAINFGYKDNLIDNLTFEVIEGDCEILPGIDVLLTPGHTPGGQSVKLNTTGGTVIITGFCCIRDNFEPSAVLAGKSSCIIPGIHLNVLDLYSSMKKIKEIGDIIVPNHDIEYFSQSVIPSV